MFRSLIFFVFLFSFFLSNANGEQKTNDLLHLKLYKQKTFEKNINIYFEKDKNQSSSTNDLFLLIEKIKKLNHIYLKTSKLIKNANDLKISFSSSYLYVKYTLD